MAKTPAFASEAELVAAFCGEIERLNGLTHVERARWAVYHETGGWDLVLVDRAFGVQVGVEAKLSLNAKVLDQALPGHWSEAAGPDYRAVLVPDGGSQAHLDGMAQAVGVTVIRMSASGEWRNFHPDLPDEGGRTWGLAHWFPWCPEKRCPLPDYLPDVQGGKAAPVQLTPWKVKAIKLMILLERRGVVTRLDMRALDLSPSRWTAAHQGFLKPDPFAGGFVRSDRTPDFKAQHPRNWTEIEADFAAWAPPQLIPAKLFSQEAPSP